MLEMARRSLEHQLPPGEIEVTIAPNAGACFGVVRAIKLGHKALENAGPIFSLGPLIHNPKVVEGLSRRGVQVVESPEGIPEGIAILRSHGIQKETEAGLRQRGIQIVDATCPLVKKPQRMAQSLGEKGYFLVVVGDSNHPEVKGVLSYFNRPDFLVTYGPEKISEIPAGITKVGAIAQTTIELKVFEEVVGEIRKRFSDVIVHNTICDATSVRQNEVVLLSQKSDVMVVVGGKNSSNTSKLVKICKQYQPATYHIEVAEEIDPQWFSGKVKVGVTGGASTPHEEVDAIGEYIAQLLYGRRA